MRREEYLGGAGGCWLSSTIWKQRLLRCRWTIARALLRIRPCRVWPALPSALVNDFLARNSKPPVEADVVITVVALIDERLDLRCVLATCLDRRWLGEAYGRGTR